MIKIEDVQLKPLRQQDLKIVFQWRNSKRIQSSMYTDHHITWEEHCEWFKSIKMNPTKQVFLFYHKAVPVGVVNFSNIDHKHSRCYWGFYIGEASAPKGSGTVMGVLALDHIFNEEGLNKVCSEVIHTNEASIRFHKKLGFVPEGRWINHVWKNHQYVDIIPMALFQSKWAQMRTKLLGGKEDDHE